MYLCHSRNLNAFHPPGHWTALNRLSVNVKRSFTSSCPVMYCIRVCVFSLSVGLECDSDTDCVYAATSVLIAEAAALWLIARQTESYTSSHYLLLLLLPLCFLYFSSIHLIHPCIAVKSNQICFITIFFYKFLQKNKVQGDII